MQKVLLTGATGFLGGWTVQRLLDAGYAVATCLNPNTTPTSRANAAYYRLGLNQRCDEYQVDLTRFEDVAELFRLVQPDAIVHMAALSDVTVALKQPFDTFQAIASISANIFEVVRRTERYIPLVSHTTDKVYGSNPVPFEEAMALRPFHVYEIAKATQDQLGQFYGRQYGLPIATVRCGNYFGPHDSNFNRIVPYTIRQNLRGEEIVLRSSGQFTRDFLYIEDAAEVNLLLLAALRDGTPGVQGEALNFSLEVQLTVREMVETICRLMDVPPRIRVEGNAAAEIPDMRLACDKARKTLSWAPRYPLADALRRTIAAYQAEHQDLSRAPQTPPSDNINPRSQRNAEKYQGAK